MAKFSTVRDEDPAKAAEMFRIGEELVKLTTKGEFRKIRQIIDSSEDGDILPYFSSKMFVESLLSGHLMIASYIIDNGYPHNSAAVPSAFHICMERADDLNAKLISEFLISKKVDVNTQLQGTWITPLHVAVRRQLVHTITALLEAGADVNAVAKDDILPLHTAESVEPSVVRDEIVSLLESRGARRTWRRDDPSTASLPPQTGVKRMETKFATFGSGPCTSASLVSWTDRDTAEVSASLAKATLTRIGGGGTGGTAPNTFSATSSTVASPPAPKKVSFRGGGPSATRVSVSSTLSVGGSSDAAGSAVGTNVAGGCIANVAKVDVETSDEVTITEQAYTEQASEHKTYERSSDGGLIFSTE